MKIERGVLLMIAISGTAMAATGDDIPVRWEKHGVTAELTSLADLPRALKKPVATNEEEGLAFSRSQESNPTEDAKRARPFYERAMTLMKSSCDGGEGLACWSLGVAYENDRAGLPMDPAAAAVAYRKAAAIYGAACDKGGKDAASSCLLLGSLYQLGSGVEKDEAKAKALFKRACDAGLAASCAK